MNVQGLLEQYMRTLIAHNQFRSPNEPLTINLGSQITGTVGVTHGGTGLTTIPDGDLLWASALNTLTAISVGLGLTVSGGSIQNNVDFNNYTNNEPGTITAGQVVAVDPSGTGIRFANATDDTRNAFGLMVGTTGTGVAGPIQTQGLMSQASWVAATGSANLTPNALYFMDIVNGKMSPTAPSVVGQTIMIVGYAVTTRQFKIQIGGKAIL